MWASLSVSLASRDRTKGEDLPQGFSKGLMNNVVRQLALSSHAAGFHSMALLLGFDWICRSLMPSASMSLP